jgi:hypothetical protein
VRAFGCLLEEVVGRCETPVPDLAGLAAACLDETPSTRPLFEEIVTRLRERHSRPT